MNDFCKVSMLKSNTIMPKKQIEVKIVDPTKPK